MVLFGTGGGSGEGVGGGKWPSHVPPVDSPEKAVRASIVRNSKADS